VLAVACTGCPAGLTARVSRIASSAEYTPPVIYSAETRAKLVFRIEALLPPGPRVPMPGQPATVMAAK
jgi:HlyD family secretion protein